MIIKIQSFIDIITNSSTEVFSIPTYKTIEIIKDIINHFLKNSDKTCDDLFDIKLNSWYYQELLKDEVELEFNNVEEFIQDWYETGEGEPGIYLEILPKDKNNPELEKIANLFIDLYKSYETGEYYC